MDQRGDLIVGLVVLEGEDGQRDRLVETFFAQQSAEDGAHLLEAESDLAAFLFTGVGENGEVGGMDFKPGRWRFGRWSGAQERRAKRECDAERDRSRARHVGHERRTAAGKCYHDVWGGVGL